MTRNAEPIPILYLAPWVDFGGSDKGTIDWFRWLDRKRFRASLITTQPSSNRRIAELVPYAEEVWNLPQLMSGHQMPAFILNFIVSRGVRLIHIMNSRLAYELLPDLSALDDPPAVVVQLHVEEEDCSGYVRLVTTRYGNLVDAFSVSSRHLAEAVSAYDIRRDHIEVIPTGVDVDGEFAPRHVVPRDLGPGPHVLYVGRLTAQKDPLLMVEVAAKVAQCRPDVRFHVVGDGDLEGNVRAAVSRTGLDETVNFHPPTTDLAPWYAASDLLLMTSAFEGVPYVLYEAMAMGLASVVPHLPGNAELLDSECGILVAPRDQADAYAMALLSLLNGNGTARKLGLAARDRVRRALSVEQMAMRHAELYERLLNAQPPHSRPLMPTPLPPPCRLPTRPCHGHPLVTVVVPCFNHGRFLPRTLASIREQTYPELDVIVVDDASIDPDTIRLLDELQGDPEITVIRQTTNAGPSAARNAGIAVAAGRYILPVDADNVLLPNAIASLVTQLQSAGERVGYIYPNLQFFGNRHEYFEAPDFDLQTLRAGNYCDTCSLIDRSVFDAGISFPEDITFGHEDWDFFLTLGTHGIHGQPANRPTLLYRKTGFTRSDSVEYHTRPFADGLRPRHPALYPTQAAGVSSAAAHRQEASLKAVWQPSISLLILEDVDTRSASGRHLLANIARQTMCDAEVIAPLSHAARLPAHGPFLRRVPPGLPDRLTSLLTMARANYVVVVQRDAQTLLEAPGFFERLIYARQEAGTSIAIAFASGGPDFRGLTFDVLHDAPGRGTPSAVALFERFGGPQLPSFITEHGDEEVASIVALLEADHVLQWRHAPAECSPRQSDPRLSHKRQHNATLREPATAREQKQRSVRRYSQPALPSTVRVRRWDACPWPAWIPPETTLLIRYKQMDGERRFVAVGNGSHEGYEVEHWLGAVQRFGPPGTARVDVTEDNDGHQIDFRAVTPTTHPWQGENIQSLGHVEQAALPLLQPLHVARVRATGQLTLVAGATDVLHGQSDLQKLVGYVEAFPNLPAAPVFESHASRRHPTLVRGIAERRHVYGVDTLTNGRVVASLGRLLPVQIAGSIAAHVLCDGTFATALYRPHFHHASLTQAARWVGAPISWWGHGPLAPRARATAHRFTRAVQMRATRPTSPRTADRDASPVGYLYTTLGPDRIELFSGIHPVTADQLVTPFPMEASDMGYVDVTSIGFARGSQNRVEIARYSTPWASRFGLAARRA